MDVLVASWGLIGFEAGDLLRSVMEAIPLSLSLRC